MWRILYDSLIGFETINLLRTPNKHALELVNQMGDHNQNLKDPIKNLIARLKPITENDLQRAYAITDKTKLIGLLHGNHVLRLKMEPYYEELIQRAPNVQFADEACGNTAQNIFRRIVKDKNSIISPKEFELISKQLPKISNTDFLKNIYYLDSAGFAELRLNQLSATRYFKEIKDEYSRKWGTVIAMKNFKVTKLYYKKHLLIGFSLYRKEDGEKFFWSGQFQEVLESLITNTDN